MAKQYVDQTHANEVCRAISAYDKNLSYPEGLSGSYYVGSNTLHKAIDLNKILKCLSALTLRQGYEICYLASGLEGEQSVLPYVIRKEEPRLQSFEEYMEHIENEQVDNWIEELGKYIQVSDTPEGYFDFAVFIRYIKNLYLYGHANYEYVQMLYAEQQIKYFCDHHGVDEYGFMPYTDEDIKKLQSLDTRSFIEKNKHGNVTVDFLAESQWGGVFRYRTSFAKRIVLVEHEEDNDPEENYDFLIPHDCGVLF